MSSGGTGTGTNGVFSPFFDLIDGAATTIQREFRQRRAQPGSGGTLTFSRPRVQNRVVTGGREHRINRAAEFARRFREERDAIAHRALGDASFVSPGSSGSTRMTQDNFSFRQDGAINWDPIMQRYYPDTVATGGSGGTPQLGP